MSAMHQVEASSNHPHGRFLGMAELIEEIGLSKPTINRLHRRGKFPAKRKLSPGRIGWFESDIEAWKANRPAVDRPG